MAALHQLRAAVLAGRTAPPPLPQAAAIVARWSADAIPPQADDSPLAGWTDSVGGLAATQATPAAQPRYRTGGQGGRPYVLFSGAQCLDAGASNPVATLCQSGVNTTLVACRNVQATSFGFLFTASASTGYNLFANGMQAGFFGSGLQRVPFTASGLNTVCYTAGRPDGTQGRVFINSTCTSAEGVIRSTAGHSVAIGSSPSNLAGLGAKAEIYEVIVWNRALTAAEVMHAEKWLRDKYAAPYPWAGAPYRVFHGDSLTNGSNKSAALTSYPARVAAINGWPIGTWSNLGQVGNTMVNMQAQGVQDIDPMVGLLGATPLHVMAWEWYNQRGLAVTDAQNASIAYLQARRSAGTGRLVFGTSIDATDGAEGGTQAKRAAYNAYFDANWASVADGYVPIHNDPSIGVEGACPNASPYTPYFHTDGIHMLDAGYNVLAGLVAPAMA